MDWIRLTWITQRIRECRRVCHVFKIFGRWELNLVIEFFPGVGHRSFMVNVSPPYFYGVVAKIFYVHK